MKSILASWESSLARYGKIDTWNRTECLSEIGIYLRKQTEETPKVRNIIKSIRDTVIAGNYDAKSLQTTIKKAITLDESLRMPTTHLPIKTNGRRVVLNGQEVRFKGETKKIFKEKLKFKDGMPLRNFDIETESARDSRIVRRIIEKRMCQAYYKMNKRDEECEATNFDKYWMNRATAFQLHNIGQKEKVRDVSRGLSTHWKRQRDPFTGEVVFKKKMAYKSQEAAIKATVEWKRKYPTEKRKMQAYQCSECGKWHIGHKGKMPVRPMTESILPQLRACC